MTTTLGALARAEQPLATLAALKLPIKTAYHLSRLLKAVGAELEHWHKARQEWIRELGEAQGDGNIAVTPANIPAFVVRLEELGSVPVTLDVEPIDLHTCGDVTMSASDLLALAEAGVATFSEAEVRPTIAPLALKGV